MITLEEIKKFYPSDIHRFDRGLLREYLQYLILSIVFSHKIGRKLSFLGGTCLRIVYGSNRFSEDIDFDNKELTEQEFGILAQYIAKELEKLGLEVEISVVSKGEVLYKIKIYDMVDTQVRLTVSNKETNYQTEYYILNKFDITKPITVTPKSVILAQKLWTITNRARAKGRDFYDIIFLLQNTKPDKQFLEEKFRSSDMGEIKRKISAYLETLDFEKLANDVKPFVISSSDLDKIRYFKTLFEQAELD